MSRPVVEVVATLGDTTLSITQLSRRGVVDGVAIDPATGDACVRRGLVDYSIRSIERPHRDLPRPAITDRRALAYIATSLAVHLAVWTLAADAEPEPPRIVERPRLIKLAFAEPVAPTIDAGTRVPVETTGPGARAPRASGEVRITRRDTPRSRESAIEQARSAGVLGAIAATGTAFRGGSIEIGSGDGGDRIIPTEEPHLGFGGGAGWGVTCDPTPVGCRFGTIGHGSGTGFGFAAKEPKLLQRPHDREAAVPIVHMCNAKSCVVSGGLDRSIIKRYVHRALPKIQYCYDKELLATPALAGTVATSFVVGRDGTVTMAGATGTSESLAACVTGVIRSIEFPRSPVDAITHVAYPFTFRQP
ncbi:MAG: AgmX/PglI C-terminal domain-containing protein [Kofleriaceae bacterium]